MTTYQWQLAIKYSSDQLRVPAGSSQGGQWTLSTISIIENTIREKGVRYDVSRIPASFRRHGAVIGAFWILRDGTIIQSRGLHKDDAVDALKIADKDTYNAVNSVVRQGIIRWHGMKGEWAFDSPKRVTIAQRQTMKDLFATIAGRQWFDVTAKFVDFIRTMDADQFMRNLQF